MSTCFDVHRYRKAGLGMCLIGESLMRAADPEAAIASLCLHPDDFQRCTQQQQQESKAGSTETTGSSLFGAYTQGTQLIKVCGITNPEDALVACQAGANMIGVIFAEKSPRKVTCEQAKQIVQAVQIFGERMQPIQTSSLPTTGSAPLSHLVQCSHWLVENTRRPVVVGVFQNQSSEVIRQVVADCGLDLVQLHGAEGMAAANVKECGAPAIRVVDISVDPETGKSSADAVDAIISSVTNDPVAILLDTSLKGQKNGGGTGLAFDWSIAQRIQSCGLPVIIAGGLHAESVGGCVQTIGPFGVDVSSGVEESPGRKNHDKVKAFVHGAKKAAQEASKGF
jgi:phosphoribosylanthranilate isomerase